MKVENNIIHVATHVHMHIRRWNVIIM